MSEVGKVFSTLEQLGLDILNKQHEVIDGALRDEVVSVSDIKAMFAKYGIELKEEVGF